MKFKVVTISSSGQKEERILEAKTKSEVFDLIRKENRTLISVKEETNQFKVNFQKMNLAVSTVREHEKVLFARNLGAMLEAGLSVSRALFVMERQTKNPKLKSIISSVQNDVKEGNSISVALSKHTSTFSSIFVAMVKAGEESGSLSESLKTISLQMEKTYLLKRKIRGALMYPGIIISAMLIIAVLMLIFVVPTLTKTFEELEVDLPASTQSIIFISNFLKDHTLLFLAIVVGVFVGLYAWMRDPKGKRSFEFIILHIPIISGLVRETNSAKTARTLSSLLSSGVEVVGALKITKDVVSNSYYRDVIESASQKVQKGVTLSKVFEESNNIYPVFVSEMISVGEETGQLPKMLERVAIFYEEDIDQKTKNMSTIIEPFLMLFIGAGVGFFALSMISPTYSLVDGL